MSSEPPVHFGCVTAAHRVRAGGPQKGQPSPPPPHAEAPTPQVLRPAPSTAAWPDGGSRPSRQHHPITCPPWTGRWPPRCECVCRAVPEAPPRVAASRLDAALAPGHSRDPRTWPQSQLQLIPSVSLWPQGAEAAETVRAWHVTVCRRPRCLGASSDGEQTPGASLRAAVCEFVRRDLCFRLVSEQAVLFVGASPSVPPYGTILRAP